MELSAQQAWARLLEAARSELPDPTVRTWLDPLEPMALEEGRLILGAPDQFAVEWNESKHSGILTRLSERVLDSRLEVAFQVQLERWTRRRVGPRDRSTSGTRSGRS
jgi:chromosomal replication initiator protein